MHKKYIILYKIHEIYLQKHDIFYKIIYNCNIKKDVIWTLIWFITYN